MLRCTVTYTRDEMAERGMPVPRANVNWVVKAVKFGGASLSGNPPPSPADLATATYRNVLRLASSAGMPPPRGTAASSPSGSGTTLSRRGPFRHPTNRSVERRTRG